MSRNWTRELGLLGASLVAAYSVARLTMGVTTETMFTALIGTAVVARLSRRPAVGLVVGVVVAAAGALWSGLFAAVGSGLPSVSRCGTFTRRCKLLGVFWCHSTCH